MKFRITMKDPDGVYDCVQDAAKAMAAQIEGVDDEERESLRESKLGKLEELTAKWFEYGEYLTVEIDTDEQSIRVVPRGGERGFPLRPGTDEQIATRMRHVCEGAHDLERHLGRKPNLCRAIGEPLLDLVVALSMLYADVNVDTSEAELDA